MFKAGRLEKGGRRKEKGGGRKVRRRGRRERGGGRKEKRVGRKEKGTPLSTPSLLHETKTIKFKCKF